MEAKVPRPRGRPRKRQKLEDDNPTRNGKLNNQGKKQVLEVEPAVPISLLGHYVRTMFSCMVSEVEEPQIEQRKKLHTLMTNQRRESARYVTGNVGRSSTMLTLAERFENAIGGIGKMYKEMKTLENWRKIVMFVCVVALAFDPLFFFIHVIGSHKFCFILDKKLGAAVCVLRTFIDTFYVIHIVFLVITESIAPRSLVSLRGELILHSKAIPRRRFLFYFIVDIVSVLPIPQVVVLSFLPSKQRIASLVTKEILKWVMFCQYIPRSIRIYPIFKEVTRASGTVAQTKWVGAALNLFLYLLPSHVIGAFWYSSAIEAKTRCWREKCAKTPGDDGAFLGKIVSYETGLYRVEYEDGDFEDMERGDLRSFLTEDNSLEDELCLRRSKLDKLIVKKEEKKKRNQRTENKGVELPDHVNGVKAEREDGDSDSSDCEDKIGSVFKNEAPVVLPVDLPPSSGTICNSSIHMCVFFFLYPTDL